MLCLGSWLKEFVSLNQGVSYQEVADALTMAGLEVEGVYEAFGDLKRGVISCVVEEVSELKGSRKLKLTRCFDGKEKRTIVCGAPNVKPGMIAPLALPGTALPNGIVIEEKEIMGVTSQGMLASMQELLLGEDGSGIWDLSSLGVDTAGVPLGEFYDLDDWVLEIGITPNRADCLSVLGISREVSALFSSSLNLAPIIESAERGRGKDTDFPVTIEAPEFCMRYMATVISGVKVQESPAWLKFKLLSMGIRPINNVVDCTNLCLLELGQPLHAFDLNLLKGPEIKVRRARDGETIETLDHKVRTLTSDMLVIADRERAVAVAGIMGGANSEVSENTHDVLLESAWFEPNQIRRTRKALKLNTEASYRFERWVDPKNVEIALRRCADLITIVAGGEIQGEVDSYPRPYRDRTARFRPERIRRLSGVAIEDQEQIDLLDRVGFKQVEGPNEAGVVEVSVPSFRFDVSEEIDIVEEIARLKGFSEIPTLSPRGDIVQSSVQAPMIDFIRTIKDIFIEQGVFEIISYSFCSRRELDALGFPEGHEIREPISILNPLTEEHSVMRTSLVPSLLQAVRRNIARKNLNLRLFEQGRCFFKDESSPTGVREEERLMCVLTGKRFPEHWAWQDNDVDVYDVKGLAENCLRKLRIKNWSFKVAEAPLPYYSDDCFAYCVTDDGSIIGCIGRISPKCLSFWDIEVPVYALELNLETLIKAPRVPKNMEPLPKFPSSERDIAVVLDDAITYGELEQFISELDVDFLEDFFIFDLYKGKPIPKGKKSVAIRFIYRAKDRTLTDEEVSVTHRTLVDSILKKFEAELRA